MLFVIVYKHSYTNIPARQKKLRGEMTDLQMLRKNDEFYCISEAVL